MAGGHLVDAVAMDVSSGGVRIVASEPLSLGATVSVVLFVEGEIVDGTATVRWTAPHGAHHHVVGLRFDTIDDDMRAHLTRYCRASVS